jgi:hypothetical protein
MNKLRAEIKQTGHPMSMLTVLAPQNDPYRCDTEARHRDGRWLRDRIAELRLVGPRHLRGLHYVMIGSPKPNGTPYTNTDDDWIWLGKAAKAARWLGYVPFDQIVDQRNDAPVVKVWQQSDPSGYVWLDFEVFLPDLHDLTPHPRLDGLTGEQPYHLVLVGEKSSLRPVLEPIADRFQADLYLPTGEISDTQAYSMALSTVSDGRPLVVFYFADCDPSGWQMPISLSRKLQALKSLQFHDLQFKMHRVGLTPDQVRLYGLPSTPLKDTERRADRWIDLQGVEQTEIDALAALQPDLLRDIAAEAIAPYFDSTLARRVAIARNEWLVEAQHAIDVQAGDRLARLREYAVEQLDDKRTEIEQILDAVRVDPDELKASLPEIVLPAARVDPGTAPEPLCDSQWSFTEQCLRLIASKRYSEITA